MDVMAILPPFPNYTDPSLSTTMESTFKPEVITLLRKRHHAVGYATDWRKLVQKKKIIEWLLSICDRNDSFCCADVQDRCNEVDVILSSKVQSTFCEINLINLIEVFVNNTTLTMLTYLTNLSTLCFNHGEIISRGWDTVYKGTSFFKMFR